MRYKDQRWSCCSTLVPLSVIAVVQLMLGTGPAMPQDLPLAPALSLTGNPAVDVITLWRDSSFLANTTAESKPAELADVATGERAGRGDSAGGERREIRRITLQQVQHAPDPLVSPLARFAQLQVEVAKQHRLGVQSDYFPKLGATFANLHYTQFLGNVLEVRRPIMGTTSQVPIPLFSQNQTLAAVMFVQPITPLLQVNQAVRIARADERIAMAKSSAAVTKNRREAEIEEAYFRLLIAQRRLVPAEMKLRNREKQQLYASASISLPRSSDQDPDIAEAKRTLAAATAQVRDLTASLNRLMGWSDESELELVPPDPLVENISLEEVADKSAANSPDVIEAGQTLVKARAASTISKLEYVPTVAAVGGYLFQNVIPLVPSNFGYGGVMVSYNLFDFGKREHTVKEARAQRDLAEMALQMTKAKVAANAKKAYLELERSRQVSLVAQKMGTSLGLLMNVNSNSESLEVKSTRAEVEAEMLEADLARRQAFARLRVLMGARR